MKNTTTKKEANNNENGCDGFALPCMLCKNSEVVEPGYLSCNIKKAINDWNHIECGCKDVRTVM